MWNSTGLNAMRLLPRPQSVRADYMCRAHILAGNETVARPKRLQPLSSTNLVFDLHHSPGAAVGVDGFGQQLFAEVDLGFGVVRGVALVFDDLEPKVVERAAHVVEAVLGLDDDLVEALGHRP